jgi:hypothetical protein
LFQQLPAGLLRDVRVALEGVRDGRVGQLDRVHERVSGDREGLTPVRNEHHLVARGVARRVLDTLPHVAPATSIGSMNASCQPSVCLSRANPVRSYC